MWTNTCIYLCSCTYRLVVYGFIWLTPHLLTNPYMVYLPTWLVDFYGKLVGKYFSPMDPSWERYLMFVWNTYSPGSLTVRPLKIDKFPKTNKKKTYFPNLPPFLQGAQTRFFKDPAGKVSLMISRKSSVWTASIFFPFFWSVTRWYIEIWRQRIC